VGVPWLAALVAAYFIWKKVSPLPAGPA